MRLIEISGKWINPEAVTHVVPEYSGGTRIYFTSQQWTKVGEPLSRVAELLNQEEE